MKRRPSVLPVALALIFCLLLPGAALAARLTNGTSDYLVSASALTLSGSSKLTVAFWLWWDAFANDDDLAMEYGTVAGQGAFNVDPNDSGASHLFTMTGYDIGGSNGARGVEITRPSAAAWHHFVISFDRSQTGASQITGSWLDGVSSGAGTGVTDLAASWGNYVLNLMARNSGASLQGAGRIAEVVLYSGYNFVQGDVDSLYNGGAGKDARTVQTPTYYWQLCGTASPEPALAGGINMTVSGATSTTHPISGVGICPDAYGWWTFDVHPASNGTSAADSGSGGNAGTLTTDNGAADKSVAGKIATAFGLDGTGDYIDIANQANFNFNQQSFTVTGWVKDVTGTGCFVSKGAGDTAAGWTVLISATGFSVWLQDGSGTRTQARDLTDSQPFNDGNWHHIAVVIFFDTVTAGNNAITIYVDGIARTMSGDYGAGGTPVQSSATVKWGSQNAATFFYLPGKIDDARIYNSGLSAGQIAALCNCPSGSLFRTQGPLTGLGTGGKFHKDPLQYRPSEVIHDR